MTYKFRVASESETFSFGLQEPETIKFSSDTNIQIVSGDFYDGQYTVTPSRETQTLHTEGLLLSENITIDPIPSNYGLVTYNGSVITIS